MTPNEKARELINTYYVNANTQAEAKASARKVVIATILKKIDEHWSDHIRDEDESSTNNHNNLRVALEELHFWHSVEYEISQA